MKKFMIVVCLVAGAMTQKTLAACDTCKGKKVITATQVVNQINVQFGNGKITTTNVNQAAGHNVYNHGARGKKVKYNPKTHQYQYVTTGTFKKAVDSLWKEDSSLQSQIDQNSNDIDNLQGSEAAHTARLDADERQLNRYSQAVDGLIANKTITMIDCKNTEWSKKIKTEKKFFYVSFLQTRTFNCKTEYYKWSRPRGWIYPTAAGLLAATGFVFHSPGENWYQWWDFKLTPPPAVATTTTTGSGNPPGQTGQWRLAPKGNQNGQPHGTWQAATPAYAAHFSGLNMVTVSNTHIVAPQQSVSQKLSKLPPIGIRYSCSFEGAKFTPANFQVW